MERSGKKAKKERMARERKNRLLMSSEHYFRSKTKDFISGCSLGSQQPASLLGGELHQHSHAPELASKGVLAGGLLTSSLVPFQYCPKDLISN